MKIIKWIKSLFTKKTKKATKTYYKPKSISRLENETYLSKKFNEALLHNIKRRMVNGGLEANVDNLIQALHDDYTAPSARFYGSDNISFDIIDVVDINRLVGKLSYGPIYCINWRVYTGENSYISGKNFISKKDLIKNYENHNISSDTK